MKKITLLTAAVFTAMFSHAQITKGSTFIGGSVLGSSDENKNENQGIESKDSHFGIGLEFGKFFATNKAAGLFANYYTNQSKDKYGTSFPTTRKIESNGLGGGFFYRQYFPLSSRWYLFGEATLGYSQNKTEQKNDDKLAEKSKTWSISASVTPGISFAVSKRLYIETGFSNLLNVSYSKTETTTYSSTGTVTSNGERKFFTASANTEGLNNFQFGLRWILPAKK